MSKTKKIISCDGSIRVRTASEPLRIFGYERRGALGSITAVLFG